MKNPDGSYLPILNDPKFDPDVDTGRAEWFRRQATERKALIAAGKKVK
ncbi:hypothetical protein G3O06_01130 [Burkholderia sp. Ac-20345]|nr:hypothetical protein [Burkholderia sp. Ac-20345]MBN3776167.1 hypothetical protein [Burkholderia sp. Ac-20345]